MSKIMKTDKSRKLYQEACKSLVRGVASNLHKGDYEEYPIYIERGQGSKIYDVDGNEYIDYMGGYGPMILGYCHPSLEKAVSGQVAKGSHFAAPTESINEVSKKLTDIIPCGDLVSYTGTGTEANMLCFRLARAYTGKDKFIKFEGHYHGWADEQMVSAAPDSLRMMGPRNKPWKTLGTVGQNRHAIEDVIVLPWNDIEIVKKTILRQGNDIAAIVLEPIMCNCEVVFPKMDYLEELRKVTRENDILLIFDEIITGFRLALGGAQEYYGVTSDISTFGKAVAGGFPLAGVAGSRAIMESGVHPVGTFNGNPVSIAACQATIQELEKPGVYDHMARLTQRLIEEIRRIAQRYHMTLHCDAVGSIWQVAFGIQERLNDYRDTFKVNKVAYQRLRMECLARGIRLHPTRGRLYTSAAHTEEDIDRTIEVLEEVLKGMPH